MPNYLPLISHDLLQYLYDSIHRERLSTIVPRYRIYFKINGLNLRSGVGRGGLGEYESVEGEIDASLSVLSLLLALIQGR